VGRWASPSPARGSTCRSSSESAAQRAGMVARCGTNAAGAEGAGPELAGAGRGPHFARVRAPGHPRGGVVEGVAGELVLRGRPRHHRHRPSLQEALPDRTAYRPWALRGKLLSRGSLDNGHVLSKAQADPGKGWAEDLRLRTGRPLSACVSRPLAAPNAASRFNHSPARGTSGCRRARCCKPSTNMAAARKRNKVSAAGKAAWTMETDFCAAPPLPSWFAP